MQTVKRNGSSSIIYNTPFENAITAGGYFPICKIDITLKDGTVFNLTEADIMTGSLQIHQSLAGSGSYETGGIAAKTMSFNINNLDGRYDNYDFSDAVVVIECGLKTEPSAAYRYTVPMGTFYVEDYKKPDDIVRLQGTDGTKFLDKTMSIDDFSSYPVSFTNILTTITKTVGGTYIPSTIRLYKSTFPTVKNSTYREWLNDIAYNFGLFFYISGSNYIVAKPYNTEAASQYTIGKNLRLSASTEFQKEYLGFFNEGEKCNTGVIKYINGTWSDLLSFEDKTQSIVSSQSKYSAVDYLTYKYYFNRNIDLQYPKKIIGCNTVFVGNPRLEFGDVITLTDTKDGDVKFTILSLDYTHGGTETLNTTTSSYKLISANDLKNMSTINIRKAEVKSDDIFYAVHNYLSTNFSTSYIYGASVGLSGNVGIEIRSNGIYYPENALLRIYSITHITDASTTPRQMTGALAQTVEVYLDKPDTAVNDVSGKTITLTYTLSNPDIFREGYFPMYSTEGKITDEANTLENCRAHPGRNNKLTIKYYYGTYPRLHIDFEKNTYSSSSDYYKAYQQANIEVEKII